MLMTMNHKYEIFFWDDVISPRFLYRCEQQKKSLSMLQTMESLW